MECAIVGIIAFKEQGRRGKVGVRLQNSLEFQIYQNRKRTIYLSLKEILINHPYSQQILF